jgi:hypothetical protein
MDKSLYFNDVHNEDSDIIAIICYLTETNLECIGRARELKSDNFSNEINRLKVLSQLLSCATRLTAQADYLIDLEGERTEAEIRRLRNEKRWKEDDFDEEEDIG